MSRVRNETVLGKIHERGPGVTVARLVAERWPHADARSHVLAYESDGVPIMMIVADANRLAPGESIEHLSHFTAGVIAALVDATLATAPEPSPV